MPLTWRLPICAPPPPAGSSFEDCVAWARRKFQQQFHDRIAQVWLRAAAEQGEPAGAWGMRLWAWSH